MKRGTTWLAKARVATTREGSSGRLMCEAQTQEREAPYSDRTASQRWTVSANMNVHQKYAAHAMRPRQRRVLLRAPTSADQREFLALARASRKLHRPWLHPPETAAEFRSYLRRSREKTFRALLVVRREDGAIVGAFNLSQIVHGSFRNAVGGRWRDHDRWAITAENRRSPSR